MKPAEVLKQLKEYKEQWRKQGFIFTKDQQEDYNRLLKLRRERVKHFYATGNVSKGGLRKKEEEKEEQTDS